MLYKNVYYLSNILITFLVHFIFDFILCWASYVPCWLHGSHTVHFLLCTKATCPVHIHFAFKIVAYLFLLIWFIILWVSAILCLFVRYFLFLCISWVSGILPVQVFVPHISAGIIHWSRTRSSFLELQFLFLRSHLNHANDILVLLFRSVFCISLSGSIVFFYVFSMNILFFLSMWYNNMFVVYNYSLLFQIWLLVFLE